MPGSGAGIRTLIVDDEPLARRRIRQFLVKAADIEIVGECGNGGLAVELIRDLRPDLMFLDIQMPQLDGFEVLQAIDPEDLPVVVFVTAHDEYAIKAFEVHALDYLLKPFDGERFQLSLQRARALLHDEQERGSRSQILELLGEARRQRKHSRRIVVKVGGKVSFVPVEEIEWIEAADNYVRLHAGRTTHLVRQTMAHFESVLDPQDFIRVHRSAMVRVSAIKEMQPWTNGEYSVTLASGARLTSSRGYRSNLVALVDGAR